MTWALLLLLAFHMLTLGMHEEDEHFDEPSRLGLILFPCPLHLSAEERNDLFGIFDAAVKSEITLPGNRYFAV
jgi:hypothetical protein